MPTATLTTLTPVHIGSGQTLQHGFDFMKMDDRIGFIDIDKIVSIIGEKFIPQLTAQIEQRKPIMDLPALRNRPLEDFSSNIAAAAGISSIAQELKAHYRTSLQGLCIPGSSIKGAIRTAIWETITTDEVTRSMRGTDLKNASGKWKDITIDRRLFGKDANTKSTRFLKVGDCAFGNQPADILEIGIYNALRNTWDFKNEKLLAEVIPSKATASFTLKLDTLLLEKNIEKYPNEWNRTDTKYISEGTAAICRLLNKYLLRQLDFERGDLEEAGFDKEYEGERMLIELDNLYNQIQELEKDAAPAFVLRIGGHNGWNFTTGGWMKKEAIQSRLSEGEISNLRRTIQKKDYGNMVLWPKTRKMTTTGIPLGFVKISFNSQ